MKRRTVKLASICMAIMLGMTMPGTTLSVRAVEPELFLQGEQSEETAPDDAELDESQLLPGEMQDSNELILGGTSDTFGPGDGIGGDVVLYGTQDVEQITTALNKGQTHLKALTQNPTIGTLGGEWSVIALARHNNLDGTVKAKYLANVYAILDEKKGVLSETKYTEYSRVVMALTSLGINAEDVNGYDLVHPLADYQKTIFQGINGAIFALIALDSNQYDMPVLTEEELAAGKQQASREMYITAIVNAQKSSGGWSLKGDDSDPDVTAMAIQALTPYYNQRSDVKAAVDKGLERLSRMQNEHGGFSSWDSENLESCAQTVIALSALDVSLLDSAEFTKNGQTVLDAMLAFQNADGSFSHALNSEAEAMATDQGNLALVAYNRALSGETSLYDMTDVNAAPPGDEKEPEGNIENFRTKLDALPESVHIDDKVNLYALYVELNAMKPFDEKAEFKQRLQDKLDLIKLQEEEVAQLGQDIWNGIQPLGISLSDKGTVDALMERYNEIHKSNQKYVENIEDLFRAEKIIQKLEQKILSKELFENVKNSSRDYVYKGKGYSITLKGDTSYIPTDMKAGITIKQTMEQLEFVMAESGAFPGSVSVSIETDLSGGAYVLYRDVNGKAESIGWLMAENGKVTCTISEGGRYFVKAEQGSPAVQIMAKGTKETEKKVSNNKLQTSGSGSTASSKKTNESNVVEGKIVDGNVEKKSLEDIKGKDVNLKIKGKLSEDKSYTLTINGKDVTECKDFKAGITQKSKYEKEIRLLAEEPWILHFEQEGKFPVKMLVEIETDKKDGEYLLFSYDVSKKKAEYLKKVTVEKGVFKFIISEGGDYFIAKRAKTKSVDQIKAEENEKEGAKKTADSEKQEEPVLAGTQTEVEKGKESGAVNTIIIVVAMALILAAGGAIVYLKKKRGNKE